MRWQQDGLQWRYSRPASRSGLRQCMAIICTTAWHRLICWWSRPRNGRLIMFRPTGDLPRATAQPNRHGLVSANRLMICAMCLCLMTLPGCSTLWPRPPAATVVPCPAIQCLDRAMQVHGGVQSEGARTCADAVILAVDALTALRQSQDAHAELVECIRRHNELPQ